MNRTFIISDTHFGHNNIYKFLDEEGSKVRPIADNSDDGDEIMVENWNRVVGPNDKVYHLGDVAIPRKGLAVMKRLNGRKILIKGNHDIFKKNDYLNHFSDIRACCPIGQYVMTHIPVHPSTLCRWKANIHGHVHCIDVRDHNGTIDPCYFNACVEKHDYTPIEFDYVDAQLRSRFGQNLVEV